MSTTIKSTSLDFENIKENLKTFLKQKEEFKDYDFEASGLNNILDVLAWNTHYNALTTNFALNESFLNTAQLRSSIISLAESVGYIPKSKSSSMAVLNLSIDLRQSNNKPSRISIPRYTAFQSNVDGNSFTFYTKDNLIGLNDGNDIYNLTLGDGNRDIPVFEGTIKRKSFIADEESRNAIYIISDTDIDIESVVVKVYDSVTTDLFTTYKDIKDVSTIDENTAFYILKESPNGYYELTFSGGSTLGKYPLPGYKIEVEYFSTKGSEANRATTFTPLLDYVNPLEPERAYEIKTITKSESSGGSDIENIESIRKNAPFQYAAQNRMVTSVDYSSLILRKFGNYIEDIQSYGGEDALEKEFGTVFISIVFKDDEIINESFKESIKSQIVDLVGDLAVVSFNVKFVDPIETYIQTNVYYQFNPKFTTLSTSGVNNEIDEVVKNYFETNLGKFNSSFRRSQLLTEVDEVNEAVLSSRAEVLMSQKTDLDFDRSKNYSFRFPVRIANPDDKNYIIKSSTFGYGNSRVYIRNRLNTNILELYRIDDKKVIVDNIGSYDSLKGNVNIIALNPSTFGGLTNSFKISAVPFNQSAISPTREDILLYDKESFAKAVIVTSE
jgi:hypothetical protein